MPFQRKLKQEEIVQIVQYFRHQLLKKGFNAIGKSLMALFD